MRAEVKTRDAGTLGIVFLLWLSSATFAQEPVHLSSAQTAIRVQSSLVLIDVITQDPKNGLPVRDLHREDFRVSDDGKEVSTVFFEAGAGHNTRRFIVWLVVICNEGGKVGGSRDFVGKEAYFRPALNHLEQHDTVGVAHWCDNGETHLDLLPTEDRDSPIRVLAETIKPISFHTGGDSDAVGEVTYRKMLRLIIQDAHRRTPQPLPVIVFLDGDHTGQPRSELDPVVDDVLETSGIVFGIKDEKAPRCCGLMIGEQSQISHYMASQTGGEYFSCSADGYAAALEKILMQLYFRYVLGFVPPMIDGKRHKLRVELTKEAREKHKGVRLRVRREYIPVREEPEWER
jgi:hypothetical protein